MVCEGLHQETAENSPIELRHLSIEALEKWVLQRGWPRFRARQIFSWIHGKGVTDFECMTNLSKEVRKELAKVASLQPLALNKVVEASDGTRKLRLQCADGSMIESVLIPEEEKLTQCISSQVGCGLGCRFCATATMGLKRNLRCGEIIDQVYRGRELLDQGQRISNLVFMGMGEPLNNLDQVLCAVEILCHDLGANFSPRRITISTAGAVPGIEELGRRARQVGLAVSLNATIDDVRNELMPVNKRWPLKALFNALKHYPLPRRRRITFEYVLIRGVNDTPEDAGRLPGLLSGIPAKVNLIPYNPCREDSRFQRPDPHTVEDFAEALRDRGIATFVRQSRGNDIAAACGQLICVNE